MARKTSEFSREILRVGRLLASDEATAVAPDGAVVRYRTIAPGKDIAKEINPRIAEQLLRAHVNAALKRAAMDEYVSGARRLNEAIERIASITGMDIDTVRSRVMENKKK